MRFEAGTRVLITGATSGIGKEMARQLGAKGCRLAITGRREGKLAEAAAAAREAGAQDVLELVGSVAELDEVREQYRRVKETFDGLDVVILNAGVGDSRNAKRFTVEEYRWTFETNVFGMCNWLQVVIPDMLRAKRGTIAGMSSSAAWRGFPSTGSYCASKAAVSTMLESMRVDLRGTGIDVVTVLPGFVKSEITARNNPKTMMCLLETDDGARRVLRGIEKRRRIVHFPRPFTWFLRYFIGGMPGFLYDWFATKFIKRDKQPYVDESHGGERA